MPLSNALVSYCVVLTSGLLITFAGGTAERAS